MEENRTYELKKRQEISQQRRRNLNEHSPTSITSLPKLKTVRFNPDNHAMKGRRF